MRFFRSEEALHHWQAKTNAGGEALTVPATWELSRRWYHDRLSHTYRGRTLADVEAIFQSLNFTSDFWYTRTATDRT